MEKEYSKKELVSQLRKDVLHGDDARLPFSAIQVFVNNLANSPYSDISSNIKNKIINKAQYYKHDHHELLGTGSTEYRN